MDKKIVIAVDDSRHSKNAVRYAAGVYKALKDINFTLMHVQPTISQYLLDEAKKSSQAYAELEKVNQKNSETASHLLEKYKEQMIALGIAEADIQLKNQARMLGVAKDILVFSTAGHFDALIMGRRGLSGLGEVFLGSVSANVVDHSTDTPVCFCFPLKHSNPRISHLPWIHCFLNGSAQPLRVRPWKRIFNQSSGGLFADHNNP